MDTMDFFVWLFPVIFMIHEFEEIFMTEAWYSRYKEKIDTIWPKNKPLGLDHAGPFLTASIGIGIFGEFLFVLLVCLVCVIIHNYYAWYGLFIAFVFHMLYPHLGVCIKFKGYLPGIVTGAIVFIPSLWVLYQANTILHYGVLEIVLSAVAMWVIEGLFTFNLLHKSMASWDHQLTKYAKGEPAK